MQFSDRRDKNPAELLTSGTWICFNGRDSLRLTDSGVGVTEIVRVVTSGMVVVVEEVSRGLVEVVVSGRPGRREGMGSGSTEHASHAVARPLCFMGAGNVPNVRGKMAREAYRRHRSHSPPRSSTAGRDHSFCLPPTFPTRTRPGMRTRTPIRSTRHGAPGAGTHLRVQQTRPADPLSA